MVRLRVLVGGVSPLIVRTLEVPSSATLDRLHEALLVCFGWSGEHLHVFTIRSVGYSNNLIVDAPWTWERRTALQRAAREARCGRVGVVTVR